LVAVFEHRQLGLDSLSSSALERQGCLRRERPHQLDVLREITHVHIAGHPDDQYAESSSLIRRGTPRKVCIGG
jgi:hypothetical protein